MPHAHSNGRIHGVTCAVVDITEGHRIAQTEQMLVHEVHRCRGHARHHPRDGRVADVIEEGVRDA